MSFLVALRVLFSVLVANLAFGSALTAKSKSRSSALKPRADTLTFAASDWIWTATTVSGAPRAFRKDFTPPLGKSLIAADIITTADNSLSFYVNGDHIGDGSGVTAVKLARRFCVNLLPSYNVFAVSASTTQGAGLLATILLTYSDGTTDTLRTDSSWRASNTVPVGFEQLSFDDTAWPVATVLFTYGAAPYGPIAIPTDPPVVSFLTTQWVWTDILPASGLVPPGPRAFRRTFTPGLGEVPASVNLIISADDEYSLWINGVLVGSGTSYKIAQQYTVNLAPANTLVLAVLVTNEGTVANHAGLLASVEINMAATGRANCTAGALLQTDVVWKSTAGAIPTGWELPGFDDSAWPPVVGEGTYGVAPWGTLTIAAPSAPVNA